VTVLAREEWELHARWAPERHRDDPRRGSEGVRPVVRWWAAFGRARWAVGELHREFGWAPVVLGPLTPAHRLSGCEQTLLVALLLSHRDPAAVDGASAGIVAGLDDLDTS
jgi:hypothetical protein